MTLNEYQQQALTTCMHSCKNFSYMALNLVGEVGEMTSKVAKLIRREEAYISANELDFCNGFDNEREAREAIAYELGDILWQLSGLCATFGLSLDEVAQANLDKLASRKQRGVIDGNGDNR